MYCKIVFNIFLLILIVIVCSIAAEGQACNIIRQHVFKNVNGIYSVHRMPNNTYSFICGAGYNQIIAVYDYKHDVVTFNTPIRGDSSYYVNIMDIVSSDNGDMFAVGRSSLTDSTYDMYPISLSTSSEGKLKFLLIDSSVSVRNMQNVAFVRSGGTWITFGFNLYSYKVVDSTVLYSVPTICRVNNYTRELHVDTVPSYYRQLSQNELDVLGDACVLADDKLVVNIATETSTTWRQSLAIIDHSGKTYYRLPNITESNISEYSSKVCASSNNIYFASVSKTSNRKEKKICVRLYNNVLELISSDSVLFPEGRIYIEKCSPRSNGGCVIAGAIDTSSLGSNSHLSYFLLFVDSLGKIEGKKIWNTGSESLLSDIVEIENGKYLVVGKYRDSNDSILGYMAVIEDSSSTLDLVNETSGDDSKRIIKIGNESVENRGSQDALFRICDCMGSQLILENSRIPSGSLYTMPLLPDGCYVASITLSSRVVIVSFIISASKIYYKRIKVD